MAELVIHPRVHERHPEIEDTDVESAWASCIKSIPRLDRDPREYIAVGVDGHGRLIEMVGRLLPNGTLLIYHAMTPPTRKALMELGMTSRGYA